MPYNPKHTYTFHANWREVPGVYIMLNATGNVIYVGESDNVRRRHKEHCVDTHHLMHGHHPSHMAVEVIADASLRRSREQALIREYNPPANKRL